MKHLWNGFLRISLWLASIGLMIASSGVDGAYLAKLMPLGFGWLGLVLNTVSDVSSEIMMYWYGRLQMDASSAKRKGARWLLAVNGLLVGYAWLFSWRQLLPIVRQIEQGAAEWLAPLMAAFIPVALVGIGFAQALLAGRIETVKEAPKVAKSDTDVPNTAPIEQPTEIELSADELRLAILDAMLADEPPTQAQVAEQLGITRSRVSYHVAKLREAGKLNGNGRHN